MIVDRGIEDGVDRGQPVIDESGVVGQVTRVFPMSSEVTLLTDREQAIAVQNVRTGVRGVAYGNAAGGAAGQIDLRFMPPNADVKSDDLLVTSGLDGIFPDGLPVAKVLSRRAQRGLPVRADPLHADGRDRAQPPRADPA